MADPASAAGRLPRLQELGDTGGNAERAEQHQHRHHMDPGEGLQVSTQGIGFRRPAEDHHGFEQNRLVGDGEQ